MMTKNRYLNGILAGMLFMAAGCSDNNPWDDAGGDVGGLRPEVLIDAAVGAAVTRAQMEQVPEADMPQADDFTLEITKTDGSYSKSWRYADYQPENEALRSGTYTVTARYGDPEEEGSKRPYFVGSADVTVKAGETTPVNVEAALGNAMMEITQTESFLGYFFDFSLQLLSGSTGSYVPVPRGQMDPTYVHPGQVDVVLSYTSWEGKSATVRPVSINVEAKKYYHVKLDLDTEVSGGMLHVTFDNGVEEEEVEIDLSAVENAPEPTVTASPEAKQSLLQGTGCTETPKFQLLAPAGIKSVALTLASDPAYIFSYAGKDLCSLSTDEQAAVEALGIKTIGLFKNPDKMAEVDLSAFASKLSPGSHEATLTVTDALTRTASAQLSFEVVERSLSVISVGNVAYGATEVEVTVKYNGDPKGLAFSVQTDAAMESATVKSITPITQNTGAFAVNDYKAVIEVPSMRCERGIWVRVAGQVAEGEPDVTATPVYPEYSVEVDAFAKRAIVKVTATDPAMQQTVMDNLRLEVYKNSSQMEVSKNPDSSTGLITITGLSPESSYTLRHSLDHRAKTEDMASTAFTTEVAADVPNGDFAQTTQTINIANINVGGEFKVGAINYQYKSAITISEPNDWSSINAKTCYSESSNKNTWYMVPSTYVDNGVVNIRSVAYDHSGGSISRTGSFLSNTYYCTTIPSIKSKGAGELFLGSYSYNGAETRSDGIAFTSRPSSISYEISGYEAYGSDKGVVSVDVIDIDGNILSSGKAYVSSPGTITIPLSTYAFLKKAAKLKVSVKSSYAENFEVKTPSASDLKENNNIMNMSIDANRYKTFSYGSVLKIKSIHLNYD